MIDDYDYYYTYVYLPLFLYTGTLPSFFCLILVYHNLTELKKRAARAEHDII